MHENVKFHLYCIVYVYLYLQVCRTPPPSPHIPKTQYFIIFPSLMCWLSRVRTQIASLPPQIKTSSLQGCHIDGSGGGGFPLSPNRQKFETQRKIDFFQIKLFSSPPFPVLETQFRSFTFPAPSAMLYTFYAS